MSDTKLPADLSAEIAHRDSLPKTDMFGDVGRAWSFGSGPCCDSCEGKAWVTDETIGVMGVEYQPDSLCQDDAWERVAGWSGC